MGDPFTQAVPITNSSGTTTIGYSCSVTGTFVWLAAGGTWSTVIRVAAPASNAVGVDYLLYDQSGAAPSLDTTINNGAVASGNEVDFALNANQPAELEMLGATSDAGTNYSNTATGSVYATFYCPDAITCANVLPQLMYSAQPTYPWFLSVPIAWDNSVSYQWSAEGIDDGSTSVVSLVIYNEDSQGAAYNVYVYDSSGNLFGQGTTPVIQSGSNTATGEAGTYAVVLRDLVSTLPPGIFKILVSGSSLSAVEVLQITAAPGGTATSRTAAATTLQVAYDTAPGSASSAAAGIKRWSAKRLRVTPKQMFKTLPK